MDITTLAQGKTIVSGGIGTGKTVFVQHLAQKVSETQKVVVGYFDKNDCRGEKDKETLTWLSEKYPHIGEVVKENVSPICLKQYALSEGFSTHLKKLVEQAVQDGAVCIIDGLDTYRGNEQALTWLFDIEGSIIVTLQGVGKFSPQPILDALAKANHLVKLGEITPYNNKAVCQEFFNGNIHFLSKSEPVFKESNGEYGI